MTKLDISLYPMIPDDFPSLIREIITDLRNIIDQLDSNFKSTKELIIELARKLDEEKISERSKISRLIKYILKDKIREGKITAKWIEDCRPEDYKRKYSKSEENSHLKKAKNLQKILIDNRGKVHAELVSLDGSGKETLKQKDDAKD
jgi:predicted alternative tryptophan synthase beta-subunit